MLSRALAATPWGIEARLVEVEVDVSTGIPTTQIVGLPDAAVRESRDRVRAAVKNSGFSLDARVVVINLAPADLRKEGNHLDVAIAVALLGAYGKIPAEALANIVVCGELGLDGSVRPITGALSLVECARRSGARQILLPRHNANCAATLEGIEILPIDTLSDAIEHVVGTRPIVPLRRPWDEAPPKASVSVPDLSDVRGQEAAKRALEVAAAGSHNLLLIGPPGTGKTMLAQRLPGLLPPLTRDEAIEVTKIHSVAAVPDGERLIRERPFRSPHFGASPAALVGGGTSPQPGELSLAHRGVLFLDELPEFRREALESLRQPIEDGRVTISRARARHTFPCSVSLVCSMNPCKCGHRGDPRNRCACSPHDIERYRSKVSGPLLDRIDLHVELPAPTLDELRSRPGEGTAAVRERVARARALQLGRCTDGTTTFNGELAGPQIESRCPLTPSAQKLLDAAYDRLGFSARALSRVVKVARTIADLATSKRLEAEHVAEAIQYRALDRRTSA